MGRWSIQAFGLIAALAATVPAFAVPAPAEKKSDTIADQENFIPQRKHMAVAGKIIGVLVADPQAVLSTEGRSGPLDELCIGWNGGSYRWVYVPVKEKAMIQNLQVPLPDGKLKAYPSLSMANPANVKPWGIETPYALVEVEINDGAGSPVNDSFVATKMRKLDESKEYPLQVAKVIGELRKKYETLLSDRQKDLDAAMDEAATKLLKDRKPTGPREKSTIMFVTWMPEPEKLVVRFRTTITDGEYKYGNGINIELRPVPLPPGPPQGGPAPPRLPNGLRYGTQFGITVGAQFEVSKTGKIDGMKTLESKSFSKELPPPPAFRGRPVPLPVLPPKKKLN
jgi:hypothetical protein